MSDINAFERDLEVLINKHSQEAASNTPDFLLAQFLTSCLITFNATVQRREAWYGRHPRTTATEIKS